MRHLVLFLAMACLGLGLVALTRSVVSYTRTHRRLDRDLCIALGLLLYHTFPGLVFGYLETNDAPLLKETPWKALWLAHSLQTPVMLALIAFVLIRLFLALQRESWRRAWLVVYWGLALTPVTYRLVDVASLFPVSIELRGRVSTAAFLVSIAVPYGSLIIVALRARLRAFQHHSPLQASSFRWLAQAVLVIVAVTSAVDLKGALAPASGEAGGILSMVPLFLVFGVCLVFLDRFVAVMAPCGHPRRGQEDTFQSLIERYGISNREKEVVRLICLGRTNKQIQGELEISLPTVKDHVSNLLRKTGVTNRVQLAALFHFDSDH